MGFYKCCGALHLKNPQSNYQTYNFGSISFSQIRAMYQVKFLRSNFNIAFLG